MAGKASGVIGLVTTLGATAVAKKAIDATWKIGAGKKPPTDPTDPDVQAREAMLWAVLSGAIVGAAKMWATRRVSKSARNDQRILAEIKAGRR
ncbi:MAG TPA: DUF4235 domain-containing protein [Nocardioidaceae bacterium]|nr:DUF4235 domain-containing protein [Nocardioidaceae bacterium]